MSEKTIPTRKEIKEKDQWDLTPLFKNENEWEQLYIEIEKYIPTYDKSTNTIWDYIKDP